MTVTSVRYHGNLSTRTVKQKTHFYTNKSAKQAYIVTDYIFFNITVNSYALYPLLKLYDKADTVQIRVRMSTVCTLTYSWKCTSDVLMAML
jgi:hypothetical protein